MLYAFPAKSTKITGIQLNNNTLFLTSERGRLRVCPYLQGAVRITYTEREAFSKEKKVGVVAKPSKRVKLSYTETEDTIEVKSGSLRLVILRESGAITYYSETNGKLFAERKTECRDMESYTTYVLADDGAAEIEKIKTADGVKEVVRAANRVATGALYHTRLHFSFTEDEAVYGLGQQENGPMNLRHSTVYVHQANRKIAIPMLVSTKGYGILTDTYSPMIFSEDAQGAYIYTEADTEMDYYFIAGNGPEAVVGGYRELTGKATMLPRWAYGFWQSQERYETQAELLSVAKEYRKRKLGLDTLVLDWCSWEGNLWGQKTMDAERFPNPAKLVEDLHKKNVHFMISIWPNMSEECDNYREMKEAGLLLPQSPIYNAFSKKARELYWEQVRRGLFCHGIDSWWCDSSEPYTPEWNHPTAQEPGVAYAEYVKDTADHMPADQTNAFGLYHAMTLYEGQRAEQDKHPELYHEKRVLNLTRSAYTGQQRLGTVLWSGDTAASWQTYRAQLVAALNFAASGLPYWTTDVGAFFVKTGFFWYWKGEYNNTTEDLGYRELYTRWFQWACFLPVFRAHGTDCHREIWQFGEKGEPFYDALAAANRLRYRFLPYTYSLAGAVWEKNRMLIKPLAFAFPGQKECYDIYDQYLYGDSVMVCPVIQPMYYGPDSTLLENAQRTRRVYLPAGCDWFDYYTEERFAGGQWIETAAELSKIPLFVRAGSILPLSKGGTYADEAVVSELVVYGGQNAEFVLYEDAGDGYGYEKGEYRTTKYTWNEKTQKLSTKVLQDGLCQSGSGTEQKRETSDVKVKLIV